jgi:hypothetical protein
VELHPYVAWWLAPQLAPSGMYLVKLLAPVRQWQADALTYRAHGRQPIPVRVCVHGANAAHPECGQEFLAQPRDLVEVKVGIGNN